MITAPLPNFRHDRSAAFRGSKLSLYEGGIRMPFIASWPGHIPANSVDSVSVITAYDLTATFASLGTTKPVNGADGTSILTILTGKNELANRAIYWEYGRNNTSFSYPAAQDRSPTLAIREGRWKLLMNHDESGIELYDMGAE